MTMQRLGYFDAATNAMKPMVALEASLGHMFISNPLHEVLKIRAFQINGCAYRPNMHLPAARQAGVSQQTLDGLAAWRESARRSIPKNARHRDGARP